MSACRVYAVCNTGHKLVLRVDFEGTRYQCHKHITSLVQHGRPTHFLHVSSLNFEAAERKFLP
jgi:hypothetical protein